MIAAATPRKRHRPALFGLAAHQRDGSGKVQPRRYRRPGRESAHEQPISDNEASNVLVGLYLLLGPAGRDAYAHDAIQIAGTGGLPLIVLLTDHRDGKALSLVATVGMQEQIAAIEATDATLN